MKLSTLILLTSVAAAGVASAQPPDGQGGTPDRQAARAAVRSACQDDMKSPCPDKQGRQMMTCLRSNNDKLSRDCQKALAQLPARQPPAAPPQN